MSASRDCQAISGPEAKGPWPPPLPPGSPLQDPEVLHDSTAGSPNSAGKEHSTGGPEGLAKGPGLTDGTRLRHLSFWVSGSLAVHWEQRWSPPRAAGKIEANFVASFIGERQGTSQLIN